MRRAYGRVAALLFVPFTPPTITECGKYRLVDVAKATSLLDRRVIVDLSFVEQQVGDERPTGPAAKRIAKPLKDHRLAVLRAYMKRAEIHDMDALGIHLHMDRSVIYGIVRGDERKYGESRLTAMLTKIGYSREDWDRVPKLARRS